MMWREFYSDEEKEEWTRPLFPKEKSNLPTKVSSSLKTFLAGSKSAFTGSILNKVRSNISTEENEALKLLIILQKERKIIIKPCDKGAGIVVCNFDDYLRSSTEHLSGHVEGKPTEKCYREITEKDFQAAKNEIDNKLKAGLASSEISKEELEAMTTADKGPGKFYQIFKVHKKHTPPNLPPGRPIISGCGSITENLSKFVDSHAKHLVPEMPAYLQDTPDFLRHLEDLKSEPIPEGAFPVSIDVVGLYSNIPHSEGIETMRESLNTRQDQSVSTAFLITLLTLVLTLNIFEFDGKLFLQLIGTAMGTIVAPTYANLFMAKFDIMLKNLAMKRMKNLCHFYKRFIDDIFMIWAGTEEEFLEFMIEINKLHPTIKFTCEYNIRERSTTFLDTRVTITDKGISTDLYKKPTDRVMYLLPDSCHPSHVFKSIPYSLALRLIRICSIPEQLETRFGELEEMLLSRNYNRNVVRAAIVKAKEIPRLEALKKVERKANERVILTVRYHPKLPSVSKILAKHWRTMTKDYQTLKWCPEPPMVAFKQPSNLKAMLCKAKIPLKAPNRDPRILLGTKPCKKAYCRTCTHIDTTKQVTSSRTLKKFTIKGDFNCNTTGVIYVITCRHCKKQYVGESGRRLRDRIGEHIHSVEMNEKTIGNHYHCPGHGLPDLKVQVIERVSPNNKQYRLEREDLWIRTLQTKNPEGLNDR